MQKIGIFFYMALFSISVVIMTNLLDTFTEAYAQTGSNQTQQQQQPDQQILTNTLTINLTKSEDIRDDEGQTFYRQIGNIETTVSELQGIDSASGGFSHASVDDSTISVTFPARVSDNQRSDEGILDIDINLDVNFVETKPDGLNIYYADSGFVPNDIGEFEVVEGVLEETSKEEAVLTLLLEQK